MATIVALGVLIVLEPVLIPLVPEVGFYGINGTQGSLIGQPPLERPSRLVGGVLLALYSGLLFAVGACLTRRRDVA